MKGLTILVTGGAGFIGSQLSERLLDLGLKVVSVDNFDPFYGRDAKNSNLKAALNHSEFHFFEGDILSNELYETLDKNKVVPNVVVHLAARAGVRPSIQNPLSYWQTNVMGTAKLFDWMKQLANKPAVIFISSSSVYGNSQKMPLSERDVINQPISPYAATKASGELLCYSAAHIEQFKIACLRLFTVYGPRQRPDLAIRKFTQLIMNNETISIYGNGTTFRDYTFVEDIVSGVIGCMKYLLNQKNGFFDIFNLGGGKPIQVKELVQLIESALDKNAKIEYLPEQQGDVTGTFSDNSKAQSAFGYRPQIPHQQGIKRTVDWLKSIKTI